ncbi:MAG TPA: 3'-5' exonuclease [Micropepsaceae bacterium]|nr:3'-5' exonuclease [Micropepsaceae bacterium]
MKAQKRISVVIFDLEFTAWEGSMASRWTRPGEYTEVVQIGAVKLTAADLKEHDAFELLAKPRINPVLSSYFIALTGITNERLQAFGVDFITAYRDFLEFVGDARLWAFGRDDLIFEGNLQRYGWPHLPLPSYSNAIPWFAANGVDLKGKHASDVAEAAGTVFTGHKHDALDDARGVAAGFRHLIANGAPNPFVADVKETSSSPLEGEGGPKGWKGG